MKAFIRLGHIRIENANAIAGMTYGFPSVTSFLGFTHALSRRLQQKNPLLKLGGCAIVCHEQQIHINSPSPWKDGVFCLTRNPPTEKGVPAPFNEEGRMHLTVSLLIECLFNGDDFDEKNTEFENYVEQLVLTQRIAGGLIIEVNEVKFVEITASAEEIPKFHKKQMRKLLPGFSLVERSDLLFEHATHLKKTQPEIEMLDVWLDFIALKHKAQLSTDENIEGGAEVKWEFVPKPTPGWLVPITTGYRAISKLYSNQVKNARDPNLPFRFVESVYTIGEWISPHRVKDLEQIFWRYHPEVESGWYLCKNSYFPVEGNYDNESNLQNGE